MDNFYCVVTFTSTYHALNFEKVLKENNIDVRLMPVPRQVSTSCGTAGKIPCDKKQLVLEICKRNHIETDEVHQIENKKSSNWFMNLINK